MLAIFFELSTAGLAPEGWCSAIEALGQQTMVAHLGLPRRDSGAGVGVESFSSVTGDLSPTSGLIRSMTSSVDVSLDVVMGVVVFDPSCMRIKPFWAVAPLVVWPCYLIPLVLRLLFARHSFLRVLTSLTLDLLSLRPSQVHSVAQSLAHFP